MSQHRIIKELWNYFEIKLFAPSLLAPYSFLPSLSYHVIRLNIKLYYFNILWENLKLIWQYHDNKNFQLIRWNYFFCCITTQTDLPAYNTKTIYLWVISICTIFLFSSIFHSLPHFQCAAADANLLPSSASPLANSTTSSSYYGKFKLVLYLLLLFWLYIKWHFLVTFILLSALWSKLPQTTIECIIYYRALIHHM